MSNPANASTRSTGWRRARLTAAPLGVAGLALALAACGSTTASSVSVPQAAVAASSTASGVVASASAPGAVLGTSSTSLGTILVDTQGRTVYEFASDSKNTSTCTGQCLTYWPIVAAPSNVSAANPGVTGVVGSFTRPDGGAQLTINGLPLYTYAGDTAPGMTTGQGSNGSGAKWWVVAPDGTPITASAATPTGSGY